MESRFARIKIEQNHAMLEIEQDHPKIHIEQPHAEVSIRTKPGKLTIDQTKAFEDMNLMSIIKRNDKHAEESLEKFNEGVQRIAREGRELMQIEKGGKTIAEQAKRRVNPPMKRLGIRFIPSRFSVKMSYEPATVDINVTPQKPRFQAELHPPKFTYYPGHVKIRLAEKNELNITVTRPD